MEQPETPLVQDAPIDAAERSLVDDVRDLVSDGRTLLEAELAAREQPGRAPAVREPFRYVDKGSMATIGRSAAVAQFNRLHLTGFPAWVAWLFVHLIFLVGFRNKLSVLLDWAWSYFTYKRGARIITASPEDGT